MDELKAMRSFARVADAGGFAPAARAMDIASTAGTRAVAHLEQRLGVRLMTRTTRRTALTDVGLERKGRPTHPQQLAAHALLLRSTAKPSCAHRLQPNSSRFAKRACVRTRKSLRQRSGLVHR